MLWTRSTNTTHYCSLQLSHTYMISHTVTSKVCQWEGQWYQDESILGRDLELTQASSLLPLTHFFHFFLFFFWAWQSIKVRWSGWAWQSIAGFTSKVSFSTIIVQKCVISQWHPGYNLIRLNNFFLTGSLMNGPYHFTHKVNYDSNTVFSYGVGWIVAATTSD